MNTAWLGGGALITNNQQSSANRTIKTDNFAATLLKMVSKSGSFFGLFASIVQTV
jgi:hypothetical protein